MDDAYESARLRGQLDHVIATGRLLAGDASEAEVLEAVLHAAMAVTAADGGSIYQVDADAGRITFRMAINDSLGLAYGVRGRSPPPFAPIPLHIDGIDNHHSVVAHCVLAGQSIAIADAYAAAGFDFSGTRGFDRKMGYHSTSFLTVPMRDHEGMITGVLQCINARDQYGAITAFPADAQAIVENLANQVATALSKRQLTAGMRDLFEAFIRLIATAIDEKSPHTGGHCKRVPELTMLLAEAAHAVTTGPLAEFKLGDADRYELRTAAWLHDCGKITTPEWVVDKATKLSGLGDRIEQIAVRFAVLAGGADERTRAALSADLEFLRRCNRGGETMRAEDQQRVAALAQRNWIDLEGVQQPLLTAAEMECLCIARGTLLPSERQIINRHITATIDMLKALPYPRHLRRVPEYAGGHHERMDGKGYPLGLTREQMSIPARIMAIADVFEALTAGDRPYKKAYTLSQALTILGQMKLDGHIDPELFDVFISAGVWRRYAELFLPAAQHDAVDLARIPGCAGLVVAENPAEKVTGAPA